jgi:hypothetical protein
VRLLSTSKSRIMLAAVAAIGCLAATMAPAEAAVTPNTVSCGGAYALSLTAHMADGYSFHVSKVQNCPIWKAGTPVYADYQTGGSTAKVGTLNVAGSGNWFVCQTTSFARTYTYDGYSSKDWAITQDDQGSWGWVPAVFFSGSSSSWTGLRECTTYEDP